MKKLSYLMAICLSFAYNSYSQSKTAAIQFDGVDDHIKVPYHSSLQIGRSAFTIEAIIRAHPTGNDNTLAPMVIGARDSLATSTSGWLFGLKDDGEIALQLHNTSISSGFGPGGGGVSADDLRDGQCHHIAWTREVGGVQDTVNGYQDGQYVRKTRKPAGTIDLVDAFDLWFGWAWYNVSNDLYQFEGEIKEIRIWNVARTETQIQDDMNKHLTGNESGLVGYWRMNENSGSIVYDCAGTNDGTFERGAQWINDFCDNMTNAAPANCGGPIGIYGIDNEKKLSLYPNPVSSEIRVNGDAEFNTVSVYDLNGKVVLRTNWNGSGPLNIEGIGTGTYLLELSNNGLQVHRELISKK